MLKWVSCKQKSLHKNEYMTCVFPCRYNLIYNLYMLYICNIHAEQQLINIVILFTDREIKKSNLPDIMNILRPVSNKWREIGSALLVKKASHDDFESNPELVKEGPEGFLRETLNAVENLTVKTLASALRSSSVQEEEIAHSLEEHFLAGKGTDISVFPFPFVITFIYHRRL